MTIPDWIKVLIPVLLFKIWRFWTLRLLPELLPSMNNQKFNQSFTSIGQNTFFSEDSKNDASISIYQSDYLYSMQLLKLIFCYARLIDHYHIQMHYFYWYSSFLDWYIYSFYRHIFQNPVFHALTQVHFLSNFRLRRFDYSYGEESISK